MICKKCGNSCSEEELYCRNCGYIIEKNLVNKDSILTDKKVEKAVKQSNTPGIISIIIPLITILLLIFNIVDFSMYVILFLISGIFFADQVKTSNKNLSLAGKIVNILCIIIIIVIQFLNVIYK